MRNEILGGAATFVAMAYIIVVNPAILKAAGLPAARARRRRLSSRRLARS
jgi:xanthine/uracil/vitamin C permease (AzgA family)